MTLNEFTNFLDKKIQENNNYIRITFYELRIKYDLSEQETEDFIKLAKNRLTNLGYEVYTNEKDKNLKNDIILEDNELVIAMKK